MSGTVRTVVSAALERGETALWLAFKEMPLSTAREELFLLHASFARGIAAREYRERSRGDLDLGDLRQFAYAGLLEAIDSYNCDRGVPFRAFASHRIRGSIRDGLTHLSEMREQLTWQHRVNRERAQSLMGSTQELSVHGAAMERFSDLAIGLAVGFMLEGTGLASDASESNAESQSAGYHSVAWNQVLSHLNVELERLPVRERAILRQHYIDGVSFDQIARLMKLSTGRVSQLHRAALGLLRKRMDRRGHFRLEV